MLSLEINPDKSAMVVFCHAESTNLNISPDVSEIGWDQLESLARELEPYLNRYSRFNLLSADSNQAYDSIECLAKMLTLPTKPIHIEPALGPLRIKEGQKEGYLAYVREHGIEAPLVDNYLRRADNELTEGTVTLERRFREFLPAYTLEVLAKDQAAFEADGYPTYTLTLASSHLEVVSYCAMGVFPGKARFPAKEQHLVNNAEHVYIGLLPEPDNYIIGFRNILDHHVQLDNETGIFKNLSSKKLSSEPGIIFRGYTR